MLVDELRQAINSRLQQWYGAKLTSVLDKACWYGLETEGRRWRPLIMVSSAMDLGIEMARVLDVAACIEVLHSASLILDDLPCMDNAQVRRGKAASHLEWGEGIALLVFADLTSFAIGRIVRFEYGELGRVSPAILDVVSREKVLLGQFADLYPKSFALTWEEGAYLKNGVVFETMLGMVTSLYAKIKGGALDLSGWARDLGMWHQAMDDLYDVMGSPVLGGKSTNVDGQRNVTQLKRQEDVLSWINRLENSLYSGAPGKLSREVVEALRDDKRRMISQDCEASGGNGQMFEVGNGAVLAPTSPESSIEGTEVTEK